MCCLCVLRPRLTNACLFLCVTVCACVLSFVMHCFLASFVLRVRLCSILLYACLLFLLNIPMSSRFPNQCLVREGRGCGPLRTTLCANCVCSVMVPNWKQEQTTTCTIVQPNIHKEQVNIETERAIIAETSPTTPTLLHGCKKTTTQGQTAETRKRKQNSH